ncbi:N-acetylmuramoyl-L-alanine amidase [Nocardioides zhouii]|nr:N-acetylmuramoyl-L-alanine amidase [Nocardioides zhouii]
MRRTIGFVIISCMSSVLSVVLPSFATAVDRTAPMRAEQVTAGVAASRVFQLPVRAEFVAPYWRGNPRAQVTLAFSLDGVHFGKPVEAGRDEIGLARHDGTTYGAIRNADGAVAVRVVTDRPLGSLTVLGLSDGAITTHRTVRFQIAESSQAATTQPLVEPRSAWGADPQYMTWTPAFYATKKLVVHHTDTSHDYADRAGAESQIRAIYYYHSVTQGWGDIGYNFLIDKFGNIYEGRYSRDYAGANPSGDDLDGRGVTGAHTQGWNSGTVGIAMLGTYTDADVTPAARQALESLLAWEASRNGIDPQATQAFVNPVSGATITTANIASHRDYAATLCPGDAFYATLPTIRRDVAARIGGTTPPADTTAPSAPLSLTATGGKNRVTLTWKPSTDDTAVTGYQIWRSQNGSTTFALVADSTGTSYVDSGLQRRTSYTYKVRAYDAPLNLSGFSNSSTAKTS